MMDAFATRVQEWQPFYMTVGAASATLIGLLFIALSLNIDTLNKRENAELMRIARLTFGDFLYVLMISLVFLVPRHTPQTMALALFVLGSSRVWQVLPILRTARGVQTADGTRSILSEFTLSLVACVGLLVLALIVLTGTPEALAGLVGVLAALLGSASYNAWSLLVQVREGGAWNSEGWNTNAKKGREKHETDAISVKVP